MRKAKKDIVSAHRMKVRMQEREDTNNPKEGRREGYRIRKGAESNLCAVGGKEGKFKWVTEERLKRIENSCGQRRRKEGLLLLNMASRGVSWRGLGHKEEERSVEVGV